MVSDAGIAVLLLHLLASLRMNNFKDHDSKIDLRQQNVVTKWTAQTKNATCKTNFMLVNQAICTGL